MTDFVQPTAIQPTTHPALLTPLDGNNALPLRGKGPFSIWVQVDTNGNAQFFRSQSDPTTFPEIQWFTGGATSPASITFKFKQDTNTITSLCSDAGNDLTFAPPTSPPPQQVGTCQPAEAEDSYSFKVNYTTQSGQSMQTPDPIIIVTPPDV